MAKKIRIQKKSLKKPDEFITSTVRVFNYISENSKKIAAYVGILLFILLIIISWRIRNRNQENKAFFQLNQAIGAYNLGERAMKEKENASEEANQGEEPIDKSKEYYDSALSRLEKVIIEFPDTIASTYAYLYSGHCLYQTGEFNKAIEAYDNFLKRNTEQNLKVLAYIKLGMSYENTENNENALNYYLNLLKTNNIPTNEFAYEGAARCYEKMGDLQKSLETYQTALDKYPNSLTSLKTKKKIAFLKDKISKNIQ